ncbi:hypothetical protein [Parachitinimonas caeni]|uniref:C2H2-type domain-containing protein n=1 Tax=Parachitinimonas caeni TaxID=3031301 RepID=A0ABT7E4M1_9NEIS|nr:hypothetical protein [Parachitinimonas caeni]MDK2126999.1 hypothetical protein [Parachitinimonas caeni]
MIDIPPSTHNYSWLEQPHGTPYNSTVYLLQVTFMYLPSFYSCSYCHENFHFPFNTLSYHHKGGGPLPSTVRSEDFLEIPKRPAWCKVCNSLTLVEDILPLQDFENAYGAIRAGKSIEYPLHCRGKDAAEQIATCKALLEWRMNRIRPARALCCGGTQFLWMDTLQPLRRHADCEYGFIDPVWYIGSFCGYAHGIHSPADYRVYDPEGELVGNLTWFNQEAGSWALQELRYAPTLDWD